MDALQAVEHLIQSHPTLITHPSRAEMIAAAVRRRECIVTQTGALALWNPKNATGRIPKDTYTVKHEGSAIPVEWKAPNNIPMTPQVFDQLLADALDVLGKKAELFLTDRMVGADPHYALPVRTIADSAITALFTDNMFRPLEDTTTSVFAGERFTVVVVPNDRIDVKKYKGALREENGKTVDVMLAMDLDRKIGLVYGTRYCGCVKKMVFTVMNGLLPTKGVLSLHCSASEDAAGITHLFLGLSGTGKTTLSADPRRKMIGDDEHMWTDDGVANLENGSYAKLIHLRQEKEPELWQATFGQKKTEENGVIIENAMVYPDGSIDVDDERIAENSRSSFPLSFLSSVKENARGGHPKTVVFLTADANGVLPAISRLTPEQALLWYLMGYTSKLAGTETGVTTPTSTFSRFFGGPFMPLTAESYLSLFKKKIQEHGTQVYLINTGWSGGAYGTGKRMDITLTRSLVDAALSGQLKDVPCTEDALFHLHVPQSAPGVSDPSVLNPKSTWPDPTAYDAAAKKLAAEFSAAFDKSYKGAVPPDVEAMCPGK